VTRLSFPLLAAAALATAALAAVPAAPLAAQTLDAPEVVEVRFEGANRIAQERLRSAIRTRETRCGRTLLAPLCWMGVGVERFLLDEELVRADELRLRLFYFERGYRDATVESSVDVARDGATVVFTVEEGRPVRVRAIEFGGEAGRVPAAMEDPLPLRTGGPLDLALLQATRDTIQSRLRNNGYASGQALAAYLIPTDSPRIARVSFDVFPGESAVFGEIEVVGASAVSPEVVRRMLTFAEGDVYSSDAVLQSQRNLYGLELFQHASIQAVPDSAADGRVPVTVRINEGDVHRVRLGAGLNSLDCGNAEGRWISRSFLGGARRLELGGRIANVLAEELNEFPCVNAGTGDIFGRLTGGLTADFVQPWFLGTDNALGAGLSLERRSVPDVFLRDTRGAYVSLSRRLGERRSLVVAYRPALTDFVAGGDPFFCVSFLACDQQSIDVLRSPHWLAPLTASLLWDGSNNVLSPTEGFLFRLDGEFASGFTGSDFPYARASGEAAVYTTLPADVVLAGRVRSGWAEAIAGVAGDRDLGLHPQRRFFAGGPNSVRGFAQSRLGPKVLVINGRQLALPVEENGAGCLAASVNDGSCDASPVPASLLDPRPTGGTLLLEGNAEVRFPLFWNRLRGVAFVDVGQVWNSSIGPAELSDLAFTPGVGVRVLSPIGPIRVDVGYNALGPETLGVKTTTVLACERVGTELTNCVAPAPGVVYDPELLVNTNELQDLAAVRWDPREDLFDRLQLHLSIGQAF